MFYVKANDTKGYRTIKEAGQAVAGAVAPDRGYWPIFRKVSGKPEPYNIEVCAYVRHNGETPYVMRIDRNGYDMPHTFTALEWR